MKPVRSFFTLMALLLWSLRTQAGGETLSAPAASPHQLFYLQRSKDANTVIYEANLTNDRKLDASKPVQVYWMRYAERGQREDLSPVQWRMAYGYQHKPSSSESGAYDISLNAFRERPLHVAYHRGKPVAMTLINGQRACLQKVFVQVDPKAHLIPRVQFIELYGADATTGQPVYERIVP